MTAHRLKILLCGREKEGQSLPLLAYGSQSWVSAGCHLALVSHFWPFRLGVGPFQSGIGPRCQRRYGADPVTKMEGVEERV